MEVKRKQRKLYINKTDVEDYILGLYQHYNKKTCTALARFVYKDFWTDEMSDYSTAYLDAMCLLLVTTAKAPDWKTFVNEFTDDFSLTTELFMKTTITYKSLDINYKTKIEEFARRTTSNYLFSDKNLTQKINWGSVYSLVDECRLAYDKIYNESSKKDAELIMAQLGTSFNGNTYGIELISAVVLVISVLLIMNAGGAYMESMIRKYGSLKVGIVMNGCVFLIVGLIHLMINKFGRRFDHDRPIACTYYSLDEIGAGQYWYNRTKRQWEYIGNSTWGFN